MKYVYLIRSQSHPKQSYIGITSDLKKRLIVHNRGGSVHTSKFKPWELIAYFAFSDAERAVAFERYLKTGSGRAFAKKRFWQSGYFPFMG
jgi:predicted GIY-YIG superfamily endonuclease